MHDYVFLIDFTTKPRIQNANVFLKDRNWKEYQQGRWKKRANSAWEWGLVVKLNSKTSSYIRPILSIMLVVDYVRIDYVWICLLRSHWGSRFCRLRSLFIWPVWSDRPVGSQMERTFSQICYWPEYPVHESELRAHLGPLLLNWPGPVLFGRPTWRNGKWPELQTFYSTHHSACWILDCAWSEHKHAIVI